jgi:hypothetical protein
MYLDSNGYVRTEELVITVLVEAVVGANADVLSARRAEKIA